MKTGFSVWLEENGKYIMGEKEAKIMEGIKRYGSFMATSKALGITYAHAWNLIDTLSKSIGEQVVRAQRGGEAGGGTALTEEGDKLLEEYLLAQDKVSRMLGSQRELRFADFRRPDLSIIGSSCPGVKILAELIPYMSEVVEVGSTVGLAALMLGESDISGIHLFDEDTQTYNIPFIRRDWPAGAAVLIRGYRREQGLMVRKGNPKGVKDLKDLSKRQVRLVNRNTGSGTRELLDRLLRQQGIVRKEVRGYEFEVRTHEEVARAIDEGRADVGLGLKATAATYKLDFVKLCDEFFDFAAEERRLSKPPIRAFIEALKSKKFQAELKKRAPGIYTLPETGNVINVT